VTGADPPCTAARWFRPAILGLVELRDALDFARTNRWSVLTTIPDDDTVGELITYYRALSGEHEDWDAYRAAMVTERRAVVRRHPDRAYGMFSLPPRSGAEQE
jgi:hypothetical protein